MPDPFKKAFVWLPGPVPESVELDPGDEVELRYQLIDYGTWLDNMNAYRVKCAIEADPRLELVSAIREDIYDLNPTWRPEVADPSDVGPIEVTPPQYVTFRIRFREIPRGMEAGEVPPVRAGVKLGTAVLVIGGAVTLAYFYDSSMEYKIKARALDISEQTLADPNATPEQKEEALKVAAEAAEDKPTVSVGDTTGLGAGLGVLGLALLGIFLLRYFE